MSDKKQLMIRLALSVMFGLCVMMVPLWLVVGSSGSFYITYQQGATRRTLEKLDQSIVDYRVQHKHPPARLDDLTWKSKDGWNRPFFYSLTNGKPLIQSLGRDGVRGGVGLDADFSNQNPRPPESAVPLWQKVGNPIAVQMDVVALMCGVLSGIPFFQGLASEKFERKRWLALGFTFSATLLLAAFGALIITSFHVPSGH